MLSGGGARGAYEVGVMKALFEGAVPVTRGRPPGVRIFTGTSIGAYNAAFLAQEADPGAAAVGLLEQVWRERIAATLASCGNGVYRLRADPLRWLDPGCLREPLRLIADLGRDAVFWTGYALVYGGNLLAADAPLRERVLESFNLAALFSRQPLEELLAATLDLARLRASPNSLGVVVTDWKNGVSRVFDKEDVAVRFGLDVILASTAVPGIFPPVELDGSPSVDGALLMNTPLSPAIAAGGRVLHVVYVDPFVSNIAPPALPNTLDTFYRLYTILLATQINWDARFAAAINSELAAVTGGPTADGSELPAVRARRDVPFGRRIGARRRGRKVYRPLIIHRYRPREDLAGAEDVLNFSTPVIDQLIAQGYHDAVHHDCDESECVLPPVDLLEAAARRWGR